ncbi:hypothetical protein JW710_02240 [Candidatus Dojkabacteria bacterium]|nr:hypothetical protein [Candidatus Dojkabacteria bacterium]
MSEQLNQIQERGEDPVLGLVWSNPFEDPERVFEELGGVISWCSKMDWERIDVAWDGGPASDPVLENAKYVQFLSCMPEPDSNIPIAAFASVHEITAITGCPDLFKIISSNRWPGQNAKFKIMEMGQSNFWMISRVIASAAFTFSRKSWDSVRGHASSQFIWTDLGCVAGSPQYFLFSGQNQVVRRDPNKVLFSDHVRPKYAPDFAVVTEQTFMNMAFYK